MVFQGSVPEPGGPFEGNRKGGGPFFSFGFCACAGGGG